ncbi:hypothetical protein KKA23_00715 [Patescibacteria group bacterium]|nr:hypothetical protein [Patescibacteria group bacterium]
MKKLVLIDSNAIIHKAFYAIPPLTNRNKEQINAIYGFSSILLKIINELKPDYVGAAYDLPAPTFRREKYAEYKSNRAKKPDELIEQIPKTKEIVKGFNIPILEMKGFEADDIIGTLSKKFKNVDVLILTGDLDTLQLIEKNIKVYALRRGMTDTKIYGAKEVMERYGLKINQLIDYKGLRGDPSDNIPGVRGVGEKTAILLLKEFGSMENLYKNIDKENKILKGKLLERLKEHKEMAFFSKELATIRLDVPIKTSLKELKLDFKIDDVKKAFDRFHFKSLISRLPGYEPEKEPEQGSLI